MGRRKCPANTFCITDTLIYVTLILATIIGVIIYNNQTTQRSVANSIQESNKSLFRSLKNIISDTFNLNLSTVSFNKRLTDPLEAPERTTPLFFKRIDMNKQTRLGIPINMETRGTATSYQQVGVLIQNGVSGDNKKILPLYGKPTYSGSQNWNYYTSSDSYHSMKVAVTNNNKSCTQEYGCSEIYDGNLINIEGYDSQFKASIYKLDKPRYIPYI
jgi:hypothetical protein